MTTRFKKLTDHPLFPLPKVYVPLFSSWVAFVGEVIATGVVGRVQLATLFSGTAYALIGYFTPLGK